MPTFQNGFVEFDDNVNFQLNESYRGLGWAQLKWMFTAFHAGHYVPLTWVTFGLDYAVWGMDPFGYHLTSLLFHAANAVLFFLVAVRLLAAAVPALASEWLGLRLAAMAAALLFALHPLRVESVAWATERRDVLCGFFYMLAILAYLNACDAPDIPARRRRFWYAGAVAACAAALLSKSMAVSLPVILLVLDVYPLRRLTLDSDRAGPYRRWVLIEKIPFVVLSASAAVLAVLAVRQAESLTQVGQLGIGARLTIAAYSLAFYLWKTVVPLNLSPLYELPASIRWSAPAYLLSDLVVLTITGTVVALWRRWPALAAAWTAYIVILLPVSGVVQAGPQIAADRYTYLSCLGWALLAAGGLGIVWRNLRRAHSPAWTGWRSVSLLLFVNGCLSALSWRQTQIWHDTGALWTHALAASPSALAHENVGSLLAEQGRIAEAFAHYEEGIRLNPRSERIHIAFGVDLAGHGRVAEAISHYEEALRLMPNSAVAYNNLGAALAAQGRTNEAIERYREALRLRPTYAEAHTNLGDALVDKGRPADAIEHQREALRLRRDFAEAHYGLGRAFAAQGSTAEALKEFGEAVAIRPSYAEAHNNFGAMLLIAGRTEAAEAQFREALRINPALREARINLERLAGRADRGAR